MRQTTHDGQTRFVQISDADQIMFNLRTAIMANCGTGSRPLGAAGASCYSNGALAAMCLCLAAIAMSMVAVVDAFAFVRQPPSSPPARRHGRQYGCTSVVASAGRSSPLSLISAQPLSRNACSEVWRLAAETDADADNVNADADNGNSKETQEEQEEEQEEEETKPTPSKIDSIIRDLHDSNLRFRIVVIGNGAILESTSTLGPHMAQTVSPKTGERLITLASDDRSFEFHLKPDAIDKVVFAESKKPDSGKTLRIVRMLRDDGGPICSLILADGSEVATSWYKTMTIRYGYEVHSGE